jgi:RND family efflux transporter MFP subunit
MERMKKRILIALALCMALGTACGKKEVEEEKTLRSVEVTTVGKGDIASEFSYTGKAAPAKEVSVVPTVPGKVLSFNYDVGDKVGQGAVLFTVDSTDLQNNMRSLQASYNAAKLGRDNAKSTYDSNKLLYDEEIISKNEFDQIKYAYESADAQLASIQVQMDNLKKNISDCTVTSPMTGVIATRGVEKGSFASQAAPAYTVMDLSTIKVEVSVSEQVLNTIQVGDKVSVLMTAASETPLTGTVATIALPQSRQACIP